MKFVALNFFSLFVFSLLALDMAVRISLRDPQDFLANENFSWPNRDRHCFKETHIPLALLRSESIVFCQSVQ